MEQNETPPAIDLDAMSSDTLRQLNLREAQKRGLQVIIEGKTMYAQDVGLSPEQQELNRVKLLQKQQGQDIGTATPQVYAYLQDEDTAAKTGRITDAQRETNRILAEAVRKKQETLPQLHIGGAQSSSLPTKK